MKDFAEPYRRLLMTAGLAGAGLLSTLAVPGAAAAAESKEPGHQKEPASPLRTARESDPASGGV